MFLTAVLGFSLATLDKDDESIYRKISGSVVEVLTSSAEGLAPVFTGTGFCVTFGTQRTFITAKHVVEGSVAVSVKINGRDYPCLVWSDPDYDYAVLKPVNKTFLSPLPLSTKTPVIGQSCWIVGNPSPGEFVYKNVLSKGIVNQISKDQSEGLTLGFSCELSSGNSGSPVVNSSGQVIGIACATFSGAQLSFGVPISKLNLSSIKKWLNH